MNDGQRALYTGAFLMLGTALGCVAPPREESGASRASLEAPSPCPPSSVETVEAGAPSTRCSCHGSLPVTCRYENWVPDLETGELVDIGTLVETTSTYAFGTVSSPAECVGSGALAASTEYACLGGTVERVGSETWTCDPVVEGGNTTAPP